MSTRPFQTRSLCAAFAFSAVVRLVLVTSVSASVEGADHRASRTDWGTASEPVDSVSLRIITSTPIFLTQGLNTSLDVELTPQLQSANTTCEMRVADSNQTAYVFMAVDASLIRRMTLMLGSKRGYSPIQHYMGSCQDTVAMLHAMQVWAVVGNHSLDVFVNTSTNASASVSVPLVVTTRSPASSSSAKCFPSVMTVTFGFLLAVVLCMGQ